MKLMSRHCRLLICPDSPGEAYNYFKQIKSLNPGTVPETAGSIKEAAWEADIILLNLRKEQLSGTMEEIRPVVCQKIIIVTDISLQAELGGILPYSKIIHASSRNGSFSLEDKSNDAESVDFVRELLYH